MKTSRKKMLCHACESPQVFTKKEPNVWSAVCFLFWLVAFFPFAIVQLVIWAIQKWTCTICGNRG